MKTAEPHAEFLAPGYFLNSDHPSVQAFARSRTSPAKSARDNAVTLFYQIRDGFRYSPFRIDLRKPAMRASALLGLGQSYCVHKAALLAASCRVLGIPARLQFFNVKNHLGTGELERALGTDLIVFHGAAQIFLEGRWLKLVPAFDKAVCAKIGVSPLEFDGGADAQFQEHLDSDGRRRFMEYLHDYGTFADFPHDLAIRELRRHYPHAFDRSVAPGKRIMFSDWED